MTKILSLSELLVAYMVLQWHVQLYTWTSFFHGYF